MLFNVLRCWISIKLIFYFEVVSGIVGFSIVVKMFIKGILVIIILNKLGFMFRIVFISKLLVFFFFIYSFFFE